MGEGRSMFLGLPNQGPFNWRSTSACWILFSYWHLWTIRGDVMRETGRPGFSSAHGILKVYLCFQCCLLPAFQRHPTVSVQYSLPSSRLEHQLTQSGVSWLCSRMKEPLRRNVLLQLWMEVGQGNLQLGQQSKRFEDNNVRAEAGYIKRFGAWFPMQHLSFTNLCLFHVAKLLA